MPPRNDLTLDQRIRVYERDRWRCLRCANRPVTTQHRVAKGSGGRGSKAEPLTCADAIALCAPCNTRAEGDLQEQALRYGWKCKRNSPIACADTPVYEALTGFWWILDPFGGRTAIEAEEAKQLILLALAD